MKHRAKKSALKIRFLERVAQRPKLLDITMGLAAILCSIFFILFVVAESFMFFDKHYNIAFETDFLEDIAPGTKVRLHASLVVGYVDSIESNFKTHLVHARIKKGFLIPKHGSRVSVQTWGFMGARFINIRILEGSDKNIPYLERDIIPMYPPNILDKSLLKLNELLITKESEKTNVLTQKLGGIRSMIRQVKNLSYFRKSVTNKTFPQGTRSFRTGLYEARNISQTLVDYIKDIHEDIIILTQDLNKNIPLLFSKTNTLKETLDYQNRLNQFLMQYIYDESDWSYYRILISALKRRSKYYVKNPHKLFTSD